MTRGEKALLFAVVVLLVVMFIVASVDPASVDVLANLKD